MNRKLRIIFAGTPDFAARALAALAATRHELCAVYTQPDRPAGRGRRLQASPVKALALELGLPVCQPTSLKDEGVRRALAEWQADLMIVAAYGLILPKAVLAIPRLGCVNIHASLLPRWRGAAPIQRAILAGDRETGVTIMQMDAGLDTGDMLVKRPCAIEPDDTAQSLHDRLAELGARAVVEALEGIAAGTLSPEPQNEAEATYAAKLDKAEAVVDWSQPAAAIERQVRAFNPWPVAQTRWRDEWLRIWQAQAVNGDAGAEPGRVVAAGRGGIDVACGEGLLRIGNLQRPGKRALSAAEFINANPLTGERLGQ